MDEKSVVIAKVSSSDSLIVKVCIESPLGIVEIYDAVELYSPIITPRDCITSWTVFDAMLAAGGGGS